MERVQWVGSGLRPLAAQTLQMWSSAPFPSFPYLKHAPNRDHGLEPKVTGSARKTYPDAAVDVKLKGQEFRGPEAIGQRAPGPGRGRSDASGAAVRVAPTTEPSALRSRHKRRLPVPRHRMLLSGCLRVIRP